MVAREHPEQAMRKEAVNLIALKGWLAKYPNPIQFKCGDRLELTGRTNTWAGHRWEWAVGPDRREGWIPDNSFERINDEVFATIDYSARELTCNAGDFLVGEFESHGWYWCTNNHGDSGWIPSEVVRVR